MAEQQTEGKKGQSPGDPRQQRQKTGIGIKIMTGAEMTLPKGMKARLDEIVKEQGYPSRNDYVVTAIREKYKRDTGKDLIVE